MNSETHFVAFGNKEFPLRMNSMQLPVFILENKQRVCSKSGIQKMLGYDGKSENWLVDLLKSIHKFSPIDKNIFEAFENPILIKLGQKKGPKVSFFCVDSSLLLPTCQIIVKAEIQGFLRIGHLKHAKLARKIILFCQDKSLEDLIDTATGYTFFKENTKEIVQQFYASSVNDPALEWVKTFPNFFFQSLLELCDLDWHRLQKNPERLAEIVFDVVFSRLPNEVIEDLRIHRPKRTYRSQKNNLNALVHPKLKEHLINIISLIETAEYNWNIFVQFLNKAYPRNLDFTSVLPPTFTDSNTKITLSTFNEHLKKLI